jgi:hypothetical protein
MTTMARHRWISSVLAVAGLACSASGTEPQHGSRDWDAERRRMVDEQLRARDIRSPRVLDAMRTVGQLPPLWWSSGTRVRRRSEADRVALLHERRGDDLQARHDLTRPTPP